MPRSRAQQIVTFKAEAALVAALDGVPNRSEFIRNAVLAALGSVCPLCRGSGILTPSQKTHWDAFTRHHSIRRCDDCRAPHLVCDQERRIAVHR